MAAVFLVIIFTIFSGHFILAKDVTLDNPLGEDDPAVLIGRVVSGVLALVGSLAFIMFIYGGITWMLARGNDKEVQKGKDILIWAIIGLAVIFAAYAILNTVFNTLAPTTAGK